MNRAHYPRLATLFAAFALLVACTNGFNSFDFGDAEDAGAAGASGSTSRDSGGEDTGAAGTPNTCPAGQQSCDGACVDLDDRRNCGGCGNDCTEQGFGAGFICESGTCVCGLSDRCGATEAVCTSNRGPCACAGTDCQPGEACVDNGSVVECGCNGGSGCSTGETCCQTPDGCFDLERDENNCGRCGHACAGDRSCVDGECRDD